MSKIVSARGVTRARLMGSNWVGAKVFANDKFALIPTSFDKKSTDVVKEALQVEACPVDVISAELHGVMIAGNNKGVLLPWNVDEDTVAAVKKLGDVNVEVLRSPYTALGNLILANSNFALVYVGFGEEELKQIRDVLDVEVQRGTLGSATTVGSLAVVTDRGLALPPSVTDEEVKKMSELFKVRADTATVNMGFNYLRLGLVANSAGALTGDLSTGPELANIEHALSFT